MSKEMGPKRLVEIYLECKDLLGNYYWVTCKSEEERKRMNNDASVLAMDMAKFLYKLEFESNREREFDKKMVDLKDHIRDMLKDEVL